MRFAIILAAAAGVALAQTAAPPALDMSVLDKLESKAKKINKVTLDQKMLKLAGGFFSDDDQDQQAAKQIIAGLRSIVVRNFEFKEKGQYSEADLAPIRAQLAKPGWSQIVESKEENEHSEVWVNNNDGKLGGIAVIDAEPEELSVVFIDGTIRPEDLRKLSGKLGLPRMGDSDDEHPGPSKKRDDKK